MLTSRTFRPRSARCSAVAQASDVLPTPPLPVKKRKRGAATALVAENDVMALGCVRRLQAAGLRVPEDVAVAGFDNTCLPHLVEIGA